MIELGATHLNRCVRHILWKDLEKGRGDRDLPSHVKRLLFQPGIGDPTGTDIPLGAEGLGLDSLARMSAASTLSRFFDMGASGLDDHLLFGDTIDDWVALISRHLQWLPSHEARIVFETSGSTLTPAVVPQRLERLCEEVDVLAQLLAGQATRRIVALVPSHHMFGWLFTVMLPSKLGLEVCEGVGRGAASVMREIAPGDMIVATPFHWRMLVDVAVGFPRDVAGVTATAPMGQDLRDRLTQAGLTGLIEVFGSTETGGIGWRKSGQDPYRLFPYMRRNEVNGVVRNCGEAAPLQDNLKWQDPVHFFPAGRLDKAVQVAGVNVSLEKVRRVLMECADVQDAVVRPFDQRLKAYVVPAPSAKDVEGLEGALIEHARKHLDPAARPVRFDFGGSLPRNSMGKLTDW